MTNLTKTDIIVIVCVAIIFPLVGLFAIESAMQLNQNVIEMTGIDASTIPPLIVQAFELEYRDQPPLIVRAFTD